MPSKQIKSAVVINLQPFEPYRTTRKHGCLLCCAELFVCLVGCHDTSVFTILLLNMKTAVSDFFTSVKFIKCLIKNILLALMLNW